jgi:uncharacterized integral membrane protein
MYFVSLPINKSTLKKRTLLLLLLLLLKIPHNFSVGLSFLNGSFYIFPILIGSHETKVF